jgi:hypothetical protein
METAEGRCADISKDLAAAVISARRKIIAEIPRRHPADAGCARAHFGFIDYAVPILNGKVDGFVKSCRRVSQDRTLCSGLQDSTRHNI